MVDNADFSVQSLLGIPASDRYDQDLRVEAAEAFIDKQRFRGI